MLGRELLAPLDEPLVVVTAQLRCGGRGQSLDLPLPPYGEGQS